MPCDIMGGGPSGLDEDYKGCPTAIALGFDEAYNEAYMFIPSISSRCQKLQEEWQRQIIRRRLADYRAHHEESAVESGSLVMA